MLLTDIAVRELIRFTLAQLRDCNYEATEDMVDRIIAHVDRSMSPKTFIDTVRYYANVVD